MSAARREGPRGASKSRLAKSRLDCLLHARGLVKSREEARGLILSGVVTVAGTRRDKAGAWVDADAEIALQADPCPYVSRGGLKLAGGLSAFGIQPAGQVVLDVGVSTGGFTDCLLQQGVARVYAVDVGYGQIAWRLRCDPRVVLLERQNIRTLPKEALPEAVDLIVIDVSFISLEKVIPCVTPYLKQDGQIVALVKPQFEVGYGRVGAGGVVRDAAQHHEVLQRVRDRAETWGLAVAGVAPSPILGKKGNKEFFVLFRASDT